jgi:tetratricopeptide (TPR) repeat protein
VEARAKATYVLQHRPDDPDAPLVLVGAASNASEADLAADQLRKLPAPAAGGAPVLTALALAETRRGRVPAAESLLQQAIKADPKFADAYSTIAAIQMSRKNIPAAIASLKQAAELSPIRSSRRLQYAQILIRTGNLAAGKSAIQAVTAQAPDFIPGWILQAEIALAERNFPECDALIEKALARDSYSLEAQMLRCRLYMVQGRNADALAVIEKVIATYPQLPTARYELARIQAASGDIGSAITNLYQVIGKMPGNAEAVMLLAGLNLRKGDPGASVILLRKLVAQRPDLIKAHMLLADAYRAQKNLDDALAIYQAVEAKFPQNPETPLLRGFILAEQKKYQPAREAFERALTLSPDEPTPLTQLVIMDLAEGKRQEALNRVAAAVAKNPKLTGPGYILQAKIYIAAKEYEPAEKVLLKALELMPDSQPVYMLLANVYRQTGQVPKAIEKLEQAMVRNPKDSSTQLLIGVLLDDRKDYAAARDAYQKVLAIDPNNFAALNNLAYLLGEKFGQLDQALKMAQKAHDLNPNEPNLDDTYGWLLYQKKQYVPALALLQDAAEKIPNLPEVQYHLGMTHYMLGEEQPARLALQQSLRPGTEFSGMDNARSALEILEINPPEATPDNRRRLEKQVTENKDDSMALLRLAAIDQRDGRTDQAIVSLQMVLQNNPKNVDALVSLARLYASKNDPAKALEFAKAARKLAPDDGTVAQTLGRLAYELGDYAWAASLLQESARKQTPTPDLLWDLALAVYSTGNVREAESALRDALAPPADGAVSLFTHAKEAQQMLELITLAADPAGASAQAGRITQMLEAQPNNVPALMVAGAIAEQAKELAKAQQAYDKALARFPNFVPAKARCAILAARKNEFDQRGYDFALQARTADPTNAEIAQALGILTYYKGDFARASALLKESAVRRPRDPDLLFHLGLSQLKSNQATEGRQNLQRALDGGLGGASATEAKRLLSEKK